MPLSSRKGDIDSDNGCFADIGWRTLIGNEFLDRIPDIAETLGGNDQVKLSRHSHMISVTIGDEPIWGGYEYRSGYIFLL